MCLLISCLCVLFRCCIYFVNFIEHKKVQSFDWTFSYYSLPFMLASNFALSNSSYLGFEGL